MFLNYFTFELDGNKVIIKQRGKIWDVKVCKSAEEAKEWKESQEHQQVLALMP